MLDRVSLYFFRFTAICDSNSLIFRCIASRAYGEDEEEEVQQNEEEVQQEEEQEEDPGHQQPPTSAV